MSLAVIGAGLPRTGTLSMKAALEQLGFGRCYHMEEIMLAPGRSEAWRRYFDGGPAKWDEVFDGFGATVDAPGCIVWRELAERYPDAKVVLTVRDREAWRQSMLNTVLSEQHQMAIAGSPVAGMFQVMAPRFMAIAGAPPPDAALPPGPPSPDLLYALYDAQRTAVIEALPPERLLEFDVREGWGPLCRFLGLEAPSTAFPRVNEAAGFHDRFSIIPAQA